MVKLDLPFVPRGDYPSFINTTQAIKIKPHNYPMALESSFFRTLYPSVARLNRLPRTVDESALDTSLGGLSALAQYS